jgi:hypothetical protein
MITMSVYVFMHVACMYVYVSMHVACMYMCMFYGSMYLRVGELAKNLRISQHHEQYYKS